MALSFYYMIVVVVFRRCCSTEPIKLSSNGIAFSRRRTVCAHSQSNHFDAAPTSSSRRQESQGRHFLSVVWLSLRYSGDAFAKTNVIAERATTLLSTACTEHILHHAAGPDATLFGKQTPVAIVYFNARAWESLHSAASWNQHSIWKPVNYRISFRQTALQASNNIIPR